MEVHFELKCAQIPFPVDHPGTGGQHVIRLFHYRASGRSHRHGHGFIGPDANGCSKRAGRGEGSLPI